MKSLPGKADKLRPSVTAGYWLKSVDISPRLVDI